MTNSSSVKTPILMTAIAVLTTVGLIGSLSGGGILEAQSTAYRGYSIYSPNT